MKMKFDINMINSYNIDLAYIRNRIFTDNIQDHLWGSLFSISSMYRIMIQGFDD